MNVQIGSRKKSKQKVKNSTLILIAFSTALLSRIVDTVGAPSTINFLHFVTVPFTCGFIFATTKTKSQKQTAISRAIIFGLFILLGVMLASALLNQAGVINVALDLMLLGEPFMLLLAIVSASMSLTSLDKLHTWLVRFSFIHTLAAFVQQYVLRLYNLLGGPDNIQGIFYRSGAGHVVGASVALTFGLYYFLSAKTAPLWLRVLVCLATFWHMLLADAKQVLLSFVVAGVLLLLTKFKDIGQALKYLIIAVVVIGILIWCIQNLEAFSAFSTWVRPEIYSPKGEASILKTASFRIIPTYYQSPLNSWLGLGPGHTIGRLGGWMLKEYEDLLIPLGATTHPASFAVWTEVGASWLGDQSSMFSPLFGWAGIWGDLGFLGLGAYLYLGYIVWSKLCFDDFSKLLVLNVFVTGLVFSQMEEPSYMLYIAMVIGLRWQQQFQTKTNNVPTAVSSRANQYFHSG